MSQSWNPNKRQRVGYDGHRGYWAQAASESSPEGQMGYDSQPASRAAYTSPNHYGSQGIFDAGFSDSDMAEMEAIYRASCAATQSQDQPFTTDLQGSTHGTLEETVCFGMVGHPTHFKCLSSSSSAF